MCFQMTKERRQYHNAFSQLIMKIMKNPLKRTLYFTDYWQRIKRMHAEADTRGLCTQIFISASSVMNSSLYDRLMLLKNVFIKMHLALLLKPDIYCWCFRIAGKLSPLKKSWLLATLRLFPAKNYRKYIPKNWPKTTVTCFCNSVTGGFSVERSRQWGCRTGACRSSLGFGSCKIELTGYI